MVCVCGRERRREKDREGDREREREGDNTHEHTAQRVPPGGIRRCTSAPVILCIVRADLLCALLLLPSLTVAAVEARIDHAPHPNLVAHLDAGHLGPNCGADPRELVARHAGVPLHA